MVKKVLRIFLLVFIPAWYVLIQAQSVSALQVQWLAFEGRQKDVGSPGPLTFHLSEGWFSVSALAVYARRKWPRKTTTEISHFWCSSVLVENHMLNGRFFFVSKDKILLCAVTYCLLKIKVMDKTYVLSEMWTVKSLWERGLGSSIFQQTGLKVTNTTCSDIKWQFQHSSPSFISQFSFFLKKHQMYYYAAYHTVLFPCCLTTII